MFDNFEKARSEGRPRWHYAVLAGVIAFQGMLVTALVVKGWWNVDKLHLPKEGVALAVAAPAPLPPPARKGSKTKAKAADVKKVVKRQTDETTQPVRLDEPVAVDDGGGETLGDPDGIPGVGAEIGCVGGPLVCGNPNDPIVNTTPPETDPCVADPASCNTEPPVVPQVAIDKRRVAGNAKIYPDRETKLEMVRDKKPRVVATVKMCLSKSGNVSSLKALKSTGYPEYDQKILGDMRGWRYDPFKVNGKATPVCTAITIVYTMASR